MMKIKPLDKESLKAAIKLKLQCWEEELANRFDYPLNYEEEYAFYERWMRTEKVDNDRRTLLGMFQNGKLIGTIFASFAEVEDHPNACEINGLFVEPDYRGQSISLLLIKEALDVYYQLGKEYVIVYNHKYAPSNAFFRYLGGKVIREEFQLNKQLHVEVFQFSITDLLNKCHKY